MNRGYEALTIFHKKNPANSVQRRKRDYEHKGRDGGTELPIYLSWLMRRWGAEKNLQSSSSLS